MTAIAAPKPKTHHPRRHVRRWSDKQTGREVRQLTDLPHGAHLGYFRYFKHLPGSRILAWARHERGNMLALDADSGDVQPIPLTVHGMLKLRERDGRLWFIKSATPPPPAVEPAPKHLPRKPRTGREVWYVDLAHAAAGVVPQPVFVAKVPDDIPGVASDITCDGRTLVLLESHQDYAKYPIPTTKEVDKIWHFFHRPRRGAIWCFDLFTGKLTQALETHHVCPLHLDTSPVDPGLIRYCQDMYDAYGQRVWSIRTDGSDMRMIRPQQFGELVTHEFWWSDPAHIGYTYQDRRGDPTTETLPWAEYSPRSTHLGIADLAGREVYLSDPLNSYHSHLYMSPDGRFVCGEGTDGHSFVYAAGFDWKSTRLAMVPLATIHTPYVPFRGQGVDCNFSADGRWLIYADKLGDSKVHQLCAVKVDLD